MSLPSMELAPIVPAISRLQRGASRISANFYGKTGPFGLISAGFWPFWLQLARDGVLIWRASRNARHVFRRAAMFHAVNRPFIPGVRMACNAPTCGYPDWRFTDFIATAIWRTSCYRKKSQRSGMHPTLGLSDREIARRAGVSPTTVGKLRRDLVDGI